MGLTGPPHAQPHPLQPRPLPLHPASLGRRLLGCWPQGSPCAQEAQGAVPARGGHALGTAAERPQHVLCHLAPKDKPHAVTLLSGCGRNQSCSPETTPISRPRSAPEPTSMRPHSEEHQGLDLAGHKPFPGGVGGVISAAVATV